VTTVKDASVAVGDGDATVGAAGEARETVGDAGWVAVGAGGRVGAALGAGGEVPLQPARKGVTSVRRKRRVHACAMSDLREEIAVPRAKSSSSHCGGNFA